MAQAIVYWIFQIIYLLILARIVLSFIRLDPYNPIVRFVHDATEPLLAPIRQMIPPAGGLDFSPMILLIGLMVLRSLIFSII